MRSLELAMKAAMQRLLEKTCKTEELVDAAFQTIKNEGFVIVRKDEVYMPECLPNPDNLGRNMTPEEIKEMEDWISHASKSEK